MNNNPIAVIDSGVGGLACLSSIREAMPGEDIIYFGDTAHMPYGSKTKEELLSYIEKIVEFLNANNVKMIILACGTMSSTVMDELCKLCPMMLIQGIVQPAVSYTNRTSSEENIIGVIATPRSIESGMYQECFSKMSKKFRTFYQACPGLADKIEQGVTEGPEMESILKSYLDDMVLNGKIDTLLLGCTHYPLVTKCINKLYPQLRVVDPAPFLAKLSYDLLAVHEMDNEQENGKLRICVSKKTDSFVNMVDMLGLSSTPIEEVAL